MELARYMQITLSTVFYLKRYTQLTNTGKGSKIVIEVGALQSRCEGAVLDSDRATSAVGIARSREDYLVYNPAVSVTQSTARTRRSYRGSPS